MPPKLPPEGKLKILSWGFKSEKPFTDEEKRRLEELTEGGEPVEIGDDYIKPIKNENNKMPKGKKNRKIGEKHE